MERVNDASLGCDYGLSDCGAAFEADETQEMKNEE